MNFDVIMYDRYREYIHYTCKYYRKLLYVYNANDGTNIAYYPEVLKFDDPAVTAFMYNASRKSFDYLGNEDFIRGSHIEILFYAVTNSVLQLYNKRSFGKLCVDSLSKVILDIWSDYQYLYKYFNGVEDDGYYQLVGVYDTLLSSPQSSTEYTNHNKYNLFIQPSLYASKIPENGKYWGEYIFILPADFPTTFYTKSIYVLPSGAEEERYTTWELQTTPISRNFYISGAMDVDSIPVAGKRHAVATAVSGGQLPSGAKLSRITEIHIPDTYTPASGSVKLQSFVPSFSYPGVDLYASIPDQVSFLYRV